MMSGKRWGYVVQFFCLLVFLGMSPFLIKMDGRKTRSVSSDSVRSQNAVSYTHLTLPTIA